MLGMFLLVMAANGSDSLPAVADNSPPSELLPPLPRNNRQKVVLRDQYHAEHVGGHHRLPHGDDPLFAWESIVVLIVAAHLLVLLFYAWVLYKDGSAAKVGAKGVHGWDADMQRRCA